MYNQKKYLAIGSLMVFAAATRLFPHPFNFTAIGALALFSGSVIPNKKWTFLIPISVMLLTDSIIGFHSSMIPVYLCFALTVVIGMTVAKQINPLTIPAASLTASLLFFLVTNLPFWYADISLYPLTWQGTIESYSAALPFFGNQIAGDLFYSVTVFGIYYVLKERYFRVSAS